MSTQEWSPDALIRKHVFFFVKSAQRVLHDWSLFAAILIARVRNEKTRLWIRNLSGPRAREPLLSLLPLPPSAPSPSLPSRMKSARCPANTNRFQAKREYCARLKGFHLNAKAIIWPLLCYMCRFRHAMKQPSLLEKNHVSPNKPQSTAQYQRLIDG